MSDPGLTAYVDAVERHVSSLRGVEHTLAPRDFALVRRWYEAGVGLAEVLAAIDEAAQRAPVTSLHACRVGSVGSNAPPARPRREDVPCGADGWGDVQERLVELRTVLRERHTGPLRKVEELVDLLSVATRPNAAHLHRALLDIDAETATLALAGCDDAARRAFEAEIAPALERQRGRVDAAALEEARRRHVEQRARQRLGLPRVAPPAGDTPS